MSIALRRFSYMRNLIRYSGNGLSHLSSFASSAPSSFSSGAPLLHYPRDLNRIGSDPFSFLRRESRRGFAKGKKSNDEDETVKVMLDTRSIKEAAVSQMDAAIVALSRELSKLRTGRASAGMLDHIIVESNGLKTPLSRVAVVSVLDSKTLSVTPYDPNALKELEHAIVSSPLGLNPTSDGQRLIAVIPPLTKEHIQAVCKVVTKSSEDVKQSIRRARQKALDTVKKAASSVSKDDAKRFEKEIDELTKKFVKSAEEMCKAKEKEITGS